MFILIWKIFNISTNTMLSELILSMIRLHTLSLMVNIEWNMLVLRQSSFNSLLRVNRLLQTTKVALPSSYKTSPTIWIILNKFFSRFFYHNILSRMVI